MTEVEKNVALDTVPTSYEGYNGESISESRFNQRYFEHTLGWDFDTVWAWDDKNNHPILRQVGLQAAVNRTPTTHNESSTETKTTDLLTQQIRANLWL